MPVPGLPTSETEKEMPPGAERCAWLQDYDCQRPPDTSWLRSNLSDIYTATQQTIMQFVANTIQNAMGPEPSEVEAGYKGPSCALFLR